MAYDGSIRINTRLDAKGFNSGVRSMMGGLGKLATMLGGLIVVEVVFAWPGLGRLVYDAVAARDYPLLQGAVLLIAAIFLLVNLIVDLLYSRVDPRIKVDQ